MPGLEEALLEFQAAPGSCEPALRQPASLFASIEEVLQLAIGRGGTADPVRAAACFFVRTALLQPGASHYAILGLDRDADLDELKKRYRLMMRLLHPDFTEGAGDWADAAVRVNLAYETLSDAGKRVDYDRKLNAQHRPRRRPPRVRAPQRHRRRPRPRRWAVRVAIAASFGAAMLLMAALVIINEPPAAQIVQRASARPPSPVAPSTFEAVLQAAQDLSAAVGSPFTGPPPAEAARTGDVLATAARNTDAPSASITVPPPASEPAVPADALASAYPMPAMPAASGASAVALAAPSRAAAAAPPEAAAPASAGVAPAATPPAPHAQPPGLTVADAHPLLARLIQQVETGRADEVLAVLDRPARSSAEAQALAREFDATVRGARPRVVSVQFKGEPREGRLLVRGSIKMKLDDAAREPADLLVQAEFIQREGAVVLTRLAPGP